ncbi:MAG: acyl-CoA ligase (AMP-forming), exosortase A system-associated [Alphaproteobacteria bacterium 64-11]|nr:acyl-CoA ligase (AMP-forming), exosortase A system-associated [Alphaproteobacteria bacterium]OJU08121.1 MAG: acyl-CoA ligase (AMP-forming), exosortase A system-associated [Alphaproteobacteria bacterium 64-11]
MIEFVDELLFDAARIHPARPALTFEGSVTSYGELAAKVRRFAGALRASGIRAKDRVGIFLDKREEAVIAIMGASAAGAVFVPINPALKSSQVSHLVEDCGIKILITAQSRIANFEDLPRCPSLEKVILVENDEAVAAWPDIQFESFRQFLESGSGEKLSLEPRAGNDMVGILYTSGSTGNAKGVVLSHRNFVARAECVSQYLKMTADDRTLNLPHYSFGFGLDQLFNAFHAGACSVLHNFVTAQGLMRTIVEERVTGVAAVPTALTTLAGMDWPQKACDTVRYIAAAGGRMPEFVTRSLRCLVPGADIYLMYGQTETLRSTFLAPSEVDRRPNSIGKAISVAQIHVVRSNGTLCGPNEPGQLVQSGETVALGYWNDAARTAQIFRPAPVALPGQSAPAIAVWSGDMVYYDAEGFLYYIGRQDDLIKTSGYRVSPTEIEDVLHASGVVEGAAAVGIKHDELGHAVVAFVVGKVGVDLDHERLMAHCRRGLPGYMVPHQLIQLDSLPLNANGKIDRRHLIADFAEQKLQPIAERTRALPKDGDQRLPGRLKDSALEMVGLKRRSIGSVAEIFASTFNLKSVDPDLTFSALGGDSLSYVDVLIALEDFIGYVPENWENIPIRDLEKLERSSAASTSMAPDVLLRAAAILGVVSFHNRYSSLSGGVSLLFLLSGFSFARFTWSSDPSQVRRSVLSTMSRIAFPTFLLLLVFFLGDGIVHWSLLLFVDNLIEPQSPLWWEGAYFVQVLFQIFLLMGILASIPGVGAFGERRPFAFGLIFTAAAALLNFALEMLVHSPVMNSGILPQYFLWQFAIGWLVFASQRQTEKIAAMVILTACLALVYVARGRTGDFILTGHAPYWLLLGSALLLWMPAIPMPRLIAAPILTIAKCTLFIYLFHWPFDVLAFRWFHVHGGPLGIAIGLAGGIAVWVLYESLASLGRSLRASPRQTAKVFG